MLSDRSLVVDDEVLLFLQTNPLAPDVMLQHALSTPQDVIAYKNVFKRYVSVMVNQWYTQSDVDRVDHRTSHFDLPFSAENTGAHGTAESVSGLQ